MNRQKSYLRLPLTASLGLVATQLMTQAYATTIVDLDCPSGTYAADDGQCLGKWPCLLSTLIPTIISPILSFILDCPAACLDCSGADSCNQCVAQATMDADGHCQCGDGLYFDSVSRVCDDVAVCEDDILFLKKRKSSEH